MGPVRIDDHAVDELDDDLLDDLVKGFPSSRPLRLGDLGTQGWNLAHDDLPLPVLTLRRSALAHNLERMRSYCQAHHVQLAPHGKTTMAPQLFKMQLDAGAWGMTAATAEQLFVYRRFGVGRVLYANQLAGRANVRLVSERLAAAEVDFYSFVDSMEAVEELVRGSSAASLTTPFKVFLEIGYQGGRSGVRSLEELAPIVRAVAGSGGRVEIAGVAAYEGQLPQDREPAAEAGVHSYLTHVGKAVDALLGEGTLSGDFLVTAGGSTAFDHVVEELGDRWPGSGTLVLRSGCYVTHDHGAYAKSSPLRAGPGALRPALELWAYVHSVPEPGLALLTLGRRDAPTDSGLPVPLRLLRAGSHEAEGLEGCDVVKMNDQHAYLSLPGSVRVRVGDRVVLGISHPCTAFDKWRLVYVVDDEETVVGGILTFF